MLGKVLQRFGENSPLSVMVRGNCIEASERRLKALRTVQVGALPGKALVVFEPA